MADQMSPTAKKSKKKSRGIRKFIPDLKSPNESAHQSNSTRVSVSSASSAHHGTDAGNAEQRASICTVLDSYLADLADSAHPPGHTAAPSQSARPSSSSPDLQESADQSRRTLNLIPSEGAHDPPRLDLTKVPAAGASRAERPDKGDRRGNASVWREISRNGMHAECLMGHKQWYKRRKPDADCYVGEKYMDPMEHEDNCQCTEEDYECDYNFVRNGKDCVPVGPEPIPAGVCTGIPDQTYKGSSGWRKIPGNTCVDGVKKDEKVDTKSQPAPGEITHQIHDFKHQIVQHAYFKNPKVKTILVRPIDHTMWQSSNEGYSWMQIHLNTASLHSTTTNTRTIAPTSSPTPTPSTQPTTDEPKAPTPPNTFGAQYSRDNGRKWSLIDSYVWNRAWAKDAELNTHPNEIICESYRDKKGNQRLFQNENPMELVTGSNYYANKRKVFDHVVGFAKFSVVAERAPGNPFFQAYTVLESSTRSLFLHMTMSEAPAPFWGDILKSNSNGTYFGLALENDNQDEQGYVDLEKMIGLDGIALANVVSNPADATLSGHKQVQSRVTHNDGSTWRPLTPPLVDSQGNKYSCEGTCALHIHGYTEQMDPRATYSSPSIVGVLMAVGNVGETLAPYSESDTFLSRDAGFTWQEVHKDAHSWEFGDSRSILVLANDEESTGYFEMWSPSENRPQQCLFGRQTLGYHRRIRNTDCIVGEQEKAASRVVFNWACSKVDFKCEFNHVKNANDESELVPGTTPLPDSDAVCRNGEEFWYERTAFRLIPYSSCTDGERPDRGRKHRCPGFKFHSARFWLFVLLLPFGFTALNAFYYYHRSGLARRYVYPASPSLLTYAILFVPSTSLETEEDPRTVAT
ncbi:uncharacterized protein LACBIDRAFT_329820 [Laccaria bicolor S238N-H82]|uniref:Predicted protein n=1 Tax=Laccaria bicolor (strain S238N-H82 / ATCC MYA-4686) TaxID=486041 RepID=B0DJB7_LACBS|nr:uncharacterized protein LACBIDRAFT_329820 [Laccaria bicolor S238N-H82]EDR05376.1 predicted protein [Laccaria bicolor S238N-H82]|eukprot:XP_001883934.1 predicted protein [Laccaria bicolor S238N-H82]